MEDLETINPQVKSKIKGRLKHKTIIKSKPAKIKAVLIPVQDVDDPVSPTISGLGFNLKLKAHSTPKVPAPTPNIGVKHVTRTQKNLTDWHLHTIIPDKDSFYDHDMAMDMAIDMVQVPLSLVADRMYVSVIPNLYKPTVLERQLFSETMADQVYYMTDEISSCNIQLNKPIMAMRHMRQFMTQLKPDWESSIYVRGSEGNMSGYQFIITGPRDTPYDNGLFLYNMTLPSDYPVKPPFINLLTTGNGKYRPNPNLYADGKVCIDLLGTFGNSWTLTSNMVQVLLAIQAQIMVEKPLCNEPMYRHASTASNIIYNALQRIITMKIAMIGPLTTPYAGFTDMIGKFFYGPKRYEIIQQMYTWVQAAEQITVHQCTQFIYGPAYRYIAGAGHGAGGGVGLLPTQDINPEQLHEGIIRMTKSHATKVLSLLYSQLPDSWAL